MSARIIVTACAAALTLALIARVLYLRNRANRYDTGEDR